MQQSFALQIDQVQKLRALAEETGKSLSELAREAVAKLLVEAC